MNDEQDVLKQLSRTLRENRDGRNPSYGLTRARVLTSVRKQNKRRSWWIRGSLPGGVLLLGTTAWAQATHQWPAVWQTVTDALQVPLSLVATEAPSTGPSSAGHSSHGLALSSVTPSSAALIGESTSDSPSVPPPMATAAELALATEAVSPAPAPPVVEDSTPRRSNIAHLELPTTPKQRAPSETPNESAPAPEPASDPEVAAFRHAYDLDVKRHDGVAALAAYERYLREYPGGRFVPEARYNAALQLLKQGRQADGRRALEAFASGKFGEYRQQSAQRLLEALNAKPAESP